MSNIYEYFKENYLSLIIILILVFLCSIQSFMIFKNNNNEIKNDNNYIAFEETKETKEQKEYVNVDIKGAVKKQGIYKIEKDSTINDVIKKANGLLKNATTIDINLSKQVYNEMVIYISTKYEYNQRNKTNKCECSNESNKESNTYEIASKDTFVSDYNNKTANKNILKSENDIIESNKSINNDNEVTNVLININKANKEEMQKIPGIGESKAQKIIDYRNENGLFKIKEDIKNVSGIGNSIYEKIKDYITI